VEGPAFHPYLSGRANLVRLDAADLTVDRRTSRARIDAADPRCGREALAPEQLQHRILARRIAADEQAARRLRIGEQVARDRRQAGRHRDVDAVAGPVAARRTGDEAGLGQRRHAI